jgi:hypothetical protein
MATKVRLLKAMATVIEKTGSGSRVWEFFLGELGRFAEMPLTEAADREAGSSIVAAVLDGYRTLVLVSREESFLAAVFRKFKTIAIMIEKKSEFCEDTVEDALVSALDVILACPAAKSINSLLHRQRIRETIERAGRKRFEPWDIEGFQGTMKTKGE